MRYILANARNFPFYILLFCFGCNHGNKLPAGVSSDPDNWVRTEQDSIHIKTFRSAGLTGQPRLVLVIHGDAPFNNPGYQYQLAHMIAKDNNNVIAIGLLRPGYTDPENNHSPGERGLTTGDNYTPEVIDNMAAAIKNLKRLYQPSSTIIAGHSGGSAITADMISRFPRIADAAVLVSCPCDVPAWRAYMKTRQKEVAIWDRPVRSLSPQELVGQIDKKTKIIVITGDKDDIAPTTLSSAYYEQLKKNGLDARLVTVKGGGHEIFLTDSVRQSIGSLLTKR